MLGRDAQAATLKEVTKDKTGLVVPKTDISLFEGLIPRLLEPVGLPSLYFFPGVTQHVISTMFRILCPR